MSDTLITLVGTYVLPDKDMPFLKDMDIYEDSWEKKDRSFSRIQSSFETSWPFDSEHIIPEFTPISNQGRAGTCVGNGWCDAYEILYGLKFGEKAVVQLSRRFAYWISRYLHSATDVDEGTFLRAMGHQFKKVGVILESVMPYSDIEADIVGKKASPKLEHYTMASNNRIEGFYRLYSEGEQMLREAEIAVRGNHPVIFAVPVTREFQQCRILKTFTRPREDDWDGWHCMIITGVRVIAGRREWLVRNSWSRFWGHEGHCWIDDSYFKLSPDTWVATLREKLI